MWVLFFVGGLGGVGVCGVVVDDVECVLGALLGVEYGAGEDFGGFGEVVQGVDVDGVGGCWRGFRGLRDEFAVGGDDLFHGFGLGFSGSSLEVEGRGGCEDDGGDGRERGGVVVCFHFEHLVAEAFDEHFDVSLCGGVVCEDFDCLAGLHVV